MKHTKSLLVVAVAAMGTIALLAGCAVTTKSSEPNSPGSSVAPSTTPSTSPTPSAPAGPTALSALVLSPEGFGPLQIGSPVTEEPASTASFVWNPTACPGTAGDPYVGAGLPNYPKTPWIDGQDTEAVTFLVKSKDSPLRSATIWSSELKTDKGIGIGSSVADLKAAYPDLAAPSRAFSSDLYVLKGSKGDLVFDVATKYQKDLTSWDKTKVGTIVWVYLIAPGEKPYSIANSDVGGYCAS